jgi:hypothetical protein
MSTIKADNISPVGSTLNLTAPVAGLSVASGLTVGGVAYFSGGATFAGTTDHTGVARFAAGVTASTIDTTGAARFNGGVTASTLDVSGVARCATAPTQGQHLANKTYVDSQDIGVGQTWENFTANRLVNTVYTNNTGKPIMVSVTCGSNQRLDPIYVGGVTIGNIVSISTTTTPFTFVVPNNTTYQCGGVGDSFNIWCELR